MSNSSGFPLQQIDNYTLATFVETVSTQDLIHSRSHTGETLLMKLVRRTLRDDCPVEFPNALLQLGADPMVCCDAGKNVLHDMFWCASSPSASPIVQAIMLCLLER